MIRVKCVGHIRSSLGRGQVDLEEGGLTPSELVEKLRGMCTGADPGFTSVNTLALINDGEAFVPATSSKKIVAGEVVLIPFSHGG